MIETIITNFNWVSSFMAQDLDIIKDSFDIPYQELMIFKFIFISLIPLIGISAIVNEYLKFKNIYFSIFLSMMVIVFILYFATRLGYFWEIKKILFVLGYLSFIISIFFKTFSFYQTVIEKSKTILLTQSYKNISVIFNMFSSRFFELLILLIPFYFLLLLQNLEMYGYDTFWHGMFSKHINHFGNFWNKESIILQSHMTTLPFFYLLQNWFMMQGEFIARVAVFSNNFFAIIGLLALYREIEQKFTTRIITFISIIIIYTMFGHGAFMGLTIEHCLSITFAFYLYFIFKKNINRNFYIVLATLPIAILMKENFIFLIPIVCFLAVMTLVKEKDIVSYLSFSKKYIYVFFIPIFFSIFIFLNYQSSINIDSVTRSPLDIFYRYEKFFNILVIAPSLIEAIFFKNIIIQGDLNNYSLLFDAYSKNVSWLFSAFAFVLIMNIILILIRKTGNRIWILPYVLNLGFIIYFIFLLAVYVFGMNMSDSSTLTSYERYMSPFIFGFILFLTILISNNLSLNKEKINSLFIVNAIIHRRTLFMSALIVIYIFNGLYCTRLFASMNPDIDFVKRERNSISHMKEFVEELDMKHEHKNVAVIFETNRANIKWIIFKYMLAPHHDVFEIKYGENMEDVKSKLLASDILAYDKIDSNQMKFVSSFFNDFDLSRKDLDACFITKNKDKIDCIN